jgi:hypothetical protein
MTTDFEDMGERPRGVLTQTDREFLRISSEDRYEQYSRQGRSRRYRTIRDRLTNSVLDLPLIVNRTDAEMFEDAFSNDDDDVPRVQTTMSDAFRFVIRAILADEPHRPIETTADLAAALSPVIHQFERGIEKWLNTQRQMTGDFEVTVSTETMRSIDSVVEELEIRRSPLTGEERVRTGTVLERAGLDDDEILALIGEDPTEEEAAEQQDYPIEQLASFDVTRLAELFAAGVISEEQHRTALEQKAETGDI